jgi:hypothetical protein
VGSGRNELQAQSHPALRRASDADHAALLIFFRGRAAQSDERAHFHFRVEIEQCAVGVDDDGLGLLGEFVLKWGAG